MPIYVYGCHECGAVEEHIQRFSDPPLTECSSCGGRLEKQVTTAAFQLKGGGWYKDLYSSAKPDKGGGGSDSGGGSSGSDGGGSKGGSDGGGSKGGSSSGSSGSGTGSSGSGTGSSGSGSSGSGSSGSGSSGSSGSSSAAE